MNICGKAEKIADRELVRSILLSFFKRFRGLEV